ncbi:glycerate kinase [Cellulomonas endophytica]|uniref:glycerate kinase n=1 Tax=Cellulomonas endophytica TaxID=2494735 RepID=UPI00196B9637|nr:glycerate kinase [Cellulomonas endophytica]
MSGAALRVVVAVDAFKGSVGSREAGAAVRAGVLAADPAADVRVVAVADGGEGTLDAVAAARGGRLVPVDTVDALGRPRRAPLLLLPDGTAVVEAATTIGLPLVAPVDATVPPRASSWGLGVQVAHAVSLGARRVLVGLGGTATTDGGAGMLAALGARLARDPSPGRNPLWPAPPAPELLLDAALPDLGGVELVALTDVTNPLLGRDGAAAVFGPQKGASPEQVAVLDAALAAWAGELEAVAGRALDVRGAGAAGGLGAAVLALGGRLEPGFDALAALGGLDEALVGADLVVTGEGSIDAQTARGKAPAGVARRGRAAGALVVGLAGRVVHPLGPTGDLFDAVLPVHPRPLPLADALDPTTTLAGLRATAEQLVRLLAAAARRPSRPHP